MKQFLPYIIIWLIAVLKFRVSISSVTFLIVQLYT